MIRVAQQEVEWPCGKALCTQNVHVFGLQRSGVLLYMRGKGFEQSALTGGRIVKDTPVKLGEHLSEIPHRQLSPRPRGIESSRLLAVLGCHFHVVYQM